MFLADKNMDLVETRALATKLAFASATSGDPETSDLNLNTFSAYMNSKFLRPSSNLTVVFTNQAQTITAANNTDVVYQVLAFGADGNIIAKTVQTVALTAGTPHNIILPATRETPARYDILAFEVKTSTEEGYGAISEIEGNYNGELGTNFYSNFREALESANAEICSMISASTLAA